MRYDTRTPHGRTYHDIEQQLKSLYDHIDALQLKCDEAREVLDAADPVIDELIGWINTDLMGCIEVEERATPVWHRVKAMRDKLDVA